MAGPFKVSSPGGKSVNAQSATKTVPAVPGKNNPVENEERQDVVPDGETPIAWPPAPGTDHKPMKFTK